MTIEHINQGDAKVSPIKKIPVVAGTIQLEPGQTVNVLEGEVSIINSSEQPIVIEEQAIETSTGLLATMAENPIKTIVVAAAVGAGCYYGYKYMTSNSSVDVAVAPEVVSSVVGIGSAFAALPAGEFFARLVA